MQLLWVGSPAWEHFKQDDVAKSLEGFMLVCNPEPEVQDVAEEFMVPVAALGHTWCSISEVKFFMWLRQPPGDDPADRIQINAQNIHQTEWSAHGMPLHEDSNLAPCLMEPLPYCAY